MAGIVSYGTYVPTYRLPRDVMAKEWGIASLGGERSVANFDEDSLTLAVNAAIDALGERDPQSLSGVFFASTTSPYREKQAAVTVATVLDANSEIRTMDFTDTLRAGTSALLTALDLVSPGKSILVCSGDSRMGEPDSQQEQTYGDAGGAILVGTDNVLAEVVGTYSISQEFLGTWRTEEQDYTRSFPGAFETKFGYNRFIAAAVQGVLKKCNLTTKDIANAAIAAPSQRVLQAALRGLGLDVKTQVQDTFWSTIGDAGTAQPLVLLAAVLERAKPGDLILVAGYGDGGDAAIFRVTDAISGFRVARSVFSQIEIKRTLSSYGKYARFRKLMKKDYTTTDVSTPVVLLRDQKEILPLHGGKCPKCNTIQFPIHRICVECGYRDGLQEIKLPRRGTLFTFTHDYLTETPDPPTTHAVIELDGGGRVYVQMADCEAERVQIGMPLELTFRKYHEGYGLKNYFWKARPINK
ncbi:MAG: hydroxymethylglutaryl-CoA synthase family protein [Deltaproteobacteria bacterium]|nr:hydroxymethylglutaryl-CoA synthase family protein [Deltaproteobacteria bacterium]